MRTRLLALIAILLILTPGLAGCVPVPEAQPVGQPAAEAPSRRIDTQIPVEIPREQVFVIDQIFRYSVVNNFNLFVSGPPTPTRQGLAFDTLWYLDQQTGEWIDSLAAAPPDYSDDFTQMTVTLREGVYWSDGTQFTADDLVYTVEMLMDTPGMLWSAEMSLYVDSVEKTDDFTVVFALKEPNPRFHAFFTSRYNALYIMPKHIWEGVEDPRTFDFYPPVSLGAYVFEDADPTGYWELYKLRDDWDRATPGILTGQAGPEYVLTVFYGGSERKIIAMARHDLDIFMDVDYEAFQALLDSTPTARSWFAEFPWAYPNELDARFFGFNYTIPPFDNKDVRWALALALDIVELQTEYIGGVTRVTAIPVPATDLHMAIYHVPLEPWLQELTIDLGNGETFQPYDPTVPQQIAEWAREQGYSVPEADDVEGLRDRFGTGWWKHAPDVAETLLLNNGFTKGSDGKWLLPDGSPFTISMIAAPDEQDVYRLAIGFQDQIRDFGIDVEIISLERDPYYTRQNTGDFMATSSWGGGNLLVNASPDLWQGLLGKHTQFYTPIGESTAGTGSNNMLRSDMPGLDEITDEMGLLHPDDPRVLELGFDALKLLTENQYTTTTISFKKFVTVDEYFWTGWPTSEAPDRQPLYWFMGGRFSLPFVEPVVE
ncbi:MAG: ABC transporter substrate-binding protein [Chloroflexi bacterium]|nr:ABC transporter substrate-binding protein [Chloroflexota bacterium]